MLLVTPSPRRLSDGTSLIVKKVKKKEVLINENLQII